MYEAHSFGNTVLNGMWFHFSEDAKAFNRDGQYMWSDRILFTPVLIQNADTVRGYFPKGVWYSLFDYSAIICYQGREIDLPTDLQSTNVHVRGGSVIPMQDYANTTAAARTTPFTLLIALDRNEQATGTLYLDDGDNDNKYCYMNYMVAKDRLSSEIIDCNLYYSASPVLKTVRILGVRLIEDCDDFEACKCFGSIYLPDHTHYEASHISIEYSNPPNLAIHFYNTNISISSNYSIHWLCRSDKNEDSILFSKSFLFLLIISVVAIFVIASFPLIIQDDGNEYILLDTRRI